MEYDYENLIIKGGGNTIYGVFGVLRILERIKILKNIKRMAGTSAGAGIIGLLSVGYTPSELISIFTTLDVSKFLDGASAGYAGYMYYLYMNAGIFQGDAIYTWYGRALEIKTGDSNITFKEIYDKYGIELVITGSCINRRETHYYRKESNPSMPIRAAISISSRMPVIFKPVIWDGDWLVDGGWTNNYPIWIFDKMYDSKKGKVVRDRSIKLNPKTLGITILTDQEDESEHVFHGNDRFNGIFDYFVGLYSSLKTSHDRMDIDKEFWPQTISIKYDKGGDISQTLDFNIPKLKRIEMIRKGEKRTIMFFNRKRIIYEAIKLVNML